MPDNTQPLDQQEKVIGTLTSGLGTVAALLALLGAGSAGTLPERMARNHQCASAVGFLAVCLSVGFALLALTLSGKGADHPPLRPRKGPKVSLRLRGRTVAEVTSWDREQWGVVFMFSVPLLLGVIFAAIWNRMHGTDFLAAEPEPGAACNWPRTAVGLGAGTSVLLALGAVIAVALFGWNRHVDWGRTLLRASALLLAGSLVVLALPAVQVQANRERPHVSAKITQGERGESLEATVKANGVPADRHVRVRVNTLQWRWEPTVDRASVRPEAAAATPLAGSPSPTPGGRWAGRVDGDDLYWADVGPNPDGQVDFQLNLPLPSGDYPMIGILAYVRSKEDDAAGQGDPDCAPDMSGCIVVSMPVRSPLPQVSASWEVASSSEPAVVVKLGPQDLLRTRARRQTPPPPGPTATPAEEVILLRVHASGAADAPTEVELYSSQVTADASGAVGNDPIKIPVSQRFKEVCVTASRAGVPDSARTPQQASGVPCPPENPFDGAWAKLRVPEAPTPTPGPGTSVANAVLAKG
jgi:hypothetical protein